MAWNNDFSSGDVLTAANLNDLAEWQAYTPQITPASGSGYSTTVNNAQYVKINKYVHCLYHITVTNPGTASGYLRFVLPVTAENTFGAGNGREVNVTNYVLGCEPLTTTTVALQLYANQTPWVTNYVFKFAYVYKAA